MTTESRYRGGGSREVVRQRPAVDPTRPQGPATADPDPELTAVLDAARRVADAARAARLSAKTSVKKAKAQESQQRRVRTAAGQKQHAGAVGSAAEAVDAAERVVTIRGRHLAPDLAGARWKSDQWRSPEFLGTGLPAALRAGRLRSHAADLPALVPVDVTGWAVTGATGPSADMISGILLRLIAKARPGGLEVICHDPRVGGQLGAFSDLRRAGLFSPPTVSADSLRAVLDAQIEKIAATANALTASGQASLADLEREAGRPLGPQRVVVLMDYPAGVDQRCQQALATLAGSARGRGLHLLIHYNPDVLPEPDVDPAGVLGSLVDVRQEGDHWRAAAGPGLELVPDGPPPRDLVTKVCARVVEAAASSAAPVVPFAPMLPTDQQRWSFDASESIRFPFGASGTGTVELELRTSNPALPNLLIGGAVGQGKSNALLVMLHGIAARYSPQDVHMYLLDLKEGLELARLGPSAGREHWMPHVQLLGLESDREFGVSVLRHLTAEFTRRARLFKTAGASDLAGFRRARPDASMPRIVAVIDEFHVLLEGGDELAREATALLERLARQGRAYGMHLVLASQTLSGMESLALKQDSIFGQFPHRVALKSTDSDSQVLLGSGNTAAADLRYRGEAVVNSNFGASASNQLVTVARADDQETDDLRRALWQRSHGEPPRIFYGSEPAHLRDLLTATAGPAEDAAWLGTAVAATLEPSAVPLRQEPGRGLAVIGAGDADAVGSLCAAAANLARSKAPAMLRLIILDVAGSGSAAGPAPRSLPATTNSTASDDPGPEPADNAATIRALTQAATRLGQRVDVVPRDAVPQELVRLNQQLLAAPGSAPSVTTLILGLGLHGLPQPTVPDPEHHISPVDALRALISSGPLHDMFLLGWWSSLRACEEQLSYDFSGLQSFMFLAASQADVQRVAGPFVTWEHRQHRALLYDPTLPQQTRLTVPFRSLDDHDVEAVVSSAQR